MSAQNGTRKDSLPLAGRSMALRKFERAVDDSSANTPLATAELVFSTGAPVVRYDWRMDRPYVEELVMDSSAIRLDRLKAGAPLCNSHSAYSLEDQIGVVENPIIANGVGTCTATFSRRESVAGYVQDVADGIIRNVSVGYVRHRIEMVAPTQDTGIWTYRVTDWEPMEVSLVPIPADFESQVMRAAGEPLPDGSAASHVRTFPCEFFQQVEPAVGLSKTDATAENPTTTRKDVSMDPVIPTVIPPVNAPVIPTVATEVQRATAAAVQRSTEIIELCARHNVNTLAADLIRAGGDMLAVRTTIADELARRDTAAGGHRNVTSITTVQDEQQTRMAGMEQAVLHRVAPGTKLDDNGRKYRGLSLIEMGRAHLEACSVNTQGMSRMELAGKMLTYRDGGMMGTSDFSSLFANLANKRLRNAYDENPGTYGMWARQAPNAPDFKNLSIVQLSGAPDLLQTNEHGEFKYGKMTDGAETYAVLTYGRIVSLTRQAIINDDLRAFERIVSAFGFASRRLENRTVYSQLTANAALSDTVALFEAGTHKNLGTGAGSALQMTALTSARTSMRLQKGLQGEELNIAPNYLIVPAALEQTAYQLTSTNYVPAKQSDTNEFRVGGRTALEAIVEPVLDANSATAWYLAASTGQVDTVEYCYLDGAEGPVMESEVGFDTDGISYKCRLDFAAKAIDYRGLYKSAGA